MIYSLVLSATALPTNPELGSASQHRESLQEQCELFKVLKCNLRHSKKITSTSYQSCITLRKIVEDWIEKYDDPHSYYFGPSDRKFQPRRLQLLADLYLQETAQGQKIWLAHDQLLMETHNKMIQKGKMVSCSPKSSNQLLDDLKAYREHGWRTAKSFSSRQEQIQESFRQTVEITERLPAFLKARDEQLQADSSGGTSQGALSKLSEDKRCTHQARHQDIGECGHSPSYTHGTTESELSEDARVENPPPPYVEDVNDSEILAHRYSSGER